MASTEGSTATQLGTTRATRRIQSRSHDSNRSTVGSQCCNNISSQVADRVHFPGVSFDETRISLPSEHVTQFNLNGMVADARRIAKAQR